MEGLSQVAAEFAVVPLCSSHQARMTTTSDTPSNSPWQGWHCPVDGCDHVALTPWLAGCDDA